MRKPAISTASKALIMSVAQRFRRVQKEAGRLLLVINNWCQGRRICSGFGGRKSYDFFKPI